MSSPLSQLLSSDQRAALPARVSEPFSAAVREMQLDTDQQQSLEAVYLPLAAALKQRATDQDTPLMVGVNGAQGAGKSTFCRLLQLVLEHGFGMRAVNLSIDDLYLTRAERADLAKRVHPLFATRGVPGTHDVALGMRLFDDLAQLGAGQTLMIPQFDKATDDRRPRANWLPVEGPIDLILFEGWCVGTRPQPDDTLDQPINRLERDEDPTGVWRRTVNHQLETVYRELFERLDLLIMLKVPGMQSVLQWRGKQERKLAAAHSDEMLQRIMDSSALERFIMHYERLTRATLAEMPDRADLVLTLNEAHQFAGSRVNGTALLRTPDP